MRRFFLLTGLVLMLPLASWATVNITTFTLKNGMKGVVIEDHRAPVVTHMVWYKIGAADEVPGKSGIAHLLEHLMFKGTKKYGPGEFSRIVSANGGSENAFTSFDYTGYFQRVASDRLGLMMDMESDRMRGLILSKADVTTERSVVLEERSTRTDDNPGALFAEQRAAALYLNQHYGIPVIGWRHEVKKLNRQDALDFYHKYYAPNDAVLVVAGDVDPANVQALAEKYYGAIKPTPGLVARDRPTEPPQLAARRLFYSDKRVAQPYVIRTYLAPERNAGEQKQAASLTMLAEVLGGSGISSVLGQNLQLKQKIALQASAFYDGLSLDKTSFGLVVVPVEGVSLKKAEDAMDAVIANFMKQGVDPAQLARIKTQVRAAQIYARDDLQGMARQYGEALTSGLTIKDVKDWPGILQSVTAKDIMAAAKMIFNRRQSVTGWLMRDNREASK